MNLGLKVGKLAISPSSTIKGLKYHLRRCRNTRTTSIILCGVLVLSMKECVIIYYGRQAMKEFETEDWTEQVTKTVQDALMMGTKYKELYEKLLWEKKILVSCICSGRTDVIGIDDAEGQTTYHVCVKSLDDDEEAVWGVEDGKIVQGYNRYSPMSAVQWMLTEMKKFEERDIES